MLGPKKELSLNNIRDLIINSLLKRSNIKVEIKAQIVLKETKFDDGLNPG
jgi:hypothetical protein